MNCCICNERVTDESQSTQYYDVDETQTAFTKEAISTFIENKLNVSLTGKSICNLCYDLINELDYTQRRCKEISDQLLENLSLQTTEVAIETIKLEPDYDHKQEPAIHIEDINETANISDTETRECEKSFKCTVCSKEWKTAYILNMHMLSHNNKKPYTCEICGKIYKQKKALKIHVEMHNGINRFTCNFCGKSFTQKKGLQRHMPIHTGYSYKTYNK